MAELLQAMNTLRVPLVKNSLLGTPPDDVTTLDHAPYPLHGYHILDVGCGAGLLCEVRSNDIRFRCAEPFRVCMSESNTLQPHYEAFMPFPNSC